jgi:glycosyltransferase involved in cell wall biosynthesis
VAQPRVLLLVTELVYGGTPRSVQTLALGLLARGYDVRAASLSSGGALARELEAAGVPVASLGFDRGHPLRAAWRLYRLLRRERPAVLHTFLFHSNLVGRVLGRLAGVPIVIASERSAEPGKAAWRIWTDRLTWRLADCWTVNAPVLIDLLARRERIDRARIDLIPTAVDVERFRPAEDRSAAPMDARLVCVGRLDRLKGHDTLLEAFVLVVAEQPRATLRLVGDGPRRAALEAQVARHGLGHHVTFTGSAGDVRPFLHGADVFVLASDTEGLPGAVLEAMACGLPVVATDVGGTSHAVLDGDTGLLVAPHDPSALARAVCRLLADRGAAQAMGHRGRARAVEQFSVSATVGHADALYERLISIRAAEGHR